jgi:hypothetical protein
MGFNYRIVKEDEHYSLREVWYGEDEQPCSWAPVYLTEPIPEDLLSVSCTKCSTDREKDAAARFEIVKQLTSIINDLSNDAAPLLLYPESFNLKGENK